MVLRVRSAQPLSRQEVEVNPYARVIFLTEYKDSDLYMRLRLLVCTALSTSNLLPFCRLGSLRVDTGVQLTCRA